MKSRRPHAKQFGAIALGIISSLGFGVTFAGTAPALADEFREEDALAADEGKTYEELTFAHPVSLSSAITVAEGAGIAIEAYPFRAIRSLVTFG